MRHNSNAYVPHWVYSVFDDAGVLLYVGVGIDPHVRIHAHRNGKNTELASRIATWKIEGPFNGRHAGRLHEQSVIREGLPLFSIHHNPRMADYRKAMWARRRATA